MLYVLMKSRTAITLPRNIDHKTSHNTCFVLTRYLAMVLETKDFPLMGTPGLEPGTRGLTDLFSNQAKIETIKIETIEINDLQKEIQLQSLENAPLGFRRPICRQRRFRAEEIDPVVLFFIERFGL
jgi:hypothetical protein